MAAPDTMSTVVLRPLVVRPEDGEFVVGSVESGEFVTLPPIGARAVELLLADGSLAAAGQRLREEFGVEVDLGDFVGQLIELGYVRSVDGRQLDAGEPVPTALPWLAPRHVGWLFRWPMLLLYTAVVLAALVTLVADPATRPGQAKFLWLSWTSLLLFSVFAMFTPVMVLHELAHLAAARSLGLPAGFSLGTRLYFLTAQTDVRCLWAVPRRQRYRVHLAGMVSDLVVFSVAVLVGSRVEAASAPLGALSMVVLFSLATQLQLFMRTDVYYVVADLARAKNLYQDAAAHALHALRRLRARLTGGRRPAGADPLAAVRPAERRVVRGYAALMTAGTTLSLAFFGLVVLPAVARIIARAALSVHAGLTGASAAVLADGLLTLGVQGAYWFLFGRALLRGRAARVRALRARLDQPSPAGPADPRP